MVVSTAQPSWAHRRGLTAAWAHRVLARTVTSRVRMFRAEPGPALDVRRWTDSSHTVCQMPDCAVYQSCRGQPLLAAGMHPGLGEVPHPDLELLVCAATGHLIGHVEGEGQIAARVGTDLVAVDPDRAGLVDGAEVKKHPFPWPKLGCGEGTAVPEPLVGLELPIHPREWGLGVNGTTIGPSYDVGRSDVEVTACSQTPLRLTQRSRASCGRGYSGSAGWGPGRDPSGSAPCPPSARPRLLGLLHVRTHVGHQVGHLLGLVPGRWEEPPPESRVARRSWPSSGRHRWDWPGREPCRPHRRCRHS